MKALSRLAILAVLALACLVFLGKAHETSLQAMDSSVHARLALEATANGWVPQLPIGISDPSSAARPGGFNDHPFPLFYLNGWVMRFFGPDAWSARLLPGLLSVGCVFLTYAIALPIAGEAYAVASAAILTATPEFVLYGARFHLDSALTFFILLSFLLWIRARPVSTGVAAGCAVLAKTPVGLLVLPSGLALALARRKRTDVMRVAIAGLAALGVVGLYWLLVWRIGGRPVVRDYWVRQVWGTAVGGRGFGGGPDYWAFFGILKSKYWPWLPLLAWGTYRLAREWKRVPAPLQLAAVGTLILVFVVSSMRFRFLHYYLPAYPFCALISAWPLAAWLEKNRGRFFAGTVAFSLVLVTVVVASPIAFAPEMFPALKRFNAIIQSYGDCRDPVVMILGNQPYGADGDYSAEIGFYAGRGLRAISCEDAPKVLGEKEFPWVIVSGDNYRRCVPDGLKKLYTHVFKYGNQYLLASLIPSEEYVDLTVLERELHAVRDCAPEPYKRDIYHAY